MLQPIDLTSEQCKKSAPSIAIAMSATMKVYGKLCPSNKLSVMWLCSYAWIIKPFTAHNVSFPRSFNLSDWKAGFSDICAPLLNRNFVFEFLLIIWKSRIEFKRPTCLVDEDCWLIYFHETSFWIGSVSSFASRQIVMLMSLQLFNYFFQLNHLFAFSTIYFPPVFGWWHHSESLHLQLRLSWVMTSLNLSAVLHSL